MRALFVGPLIIAIVHHPRHHGALRRLPLLPRADALGRWRTQCPGPRGRRPSGPTASIGPPGTPIPTWWRAGSLLGGRLRWRGPPGGRRARTRARRVEPAKVVVLRGRLAVLLGVAHRPRARSLGLLPLQRPHGPASAARLRDAAAPALRHARVDARPLLRTPERAAARPRASPARRRLRRLQPGARGVAPAARSTIWPWTSTRPHRPAPHDHGRLGHPVVARAVAARPSCRARPTRCRCCTSSWSGLPMVVVAIFISMADGAALSVLRGGAAHLGEAHPARRPAPGRAHHVDPRRHGLPRSPSPSSSSAGRPRAATTGRCPRRGAPWPLGSPLRAARGRGLSVAR